MSMPRRTLGDVGYDFAVNVARWPGRARDMLGARIYQWALARQLRAR